MGKKTGMHLAKWQEWLCLDNVISSPMLFFFHSADYIDRMLIGYMTALLSIFLVLINLSHIICIAKVI